MGKAAKLYKRPSLKEKQRKDKSSLQSAPDDEVRRGQREGLDLNELKRMAREEKMAIQRKKAAAKQASARAGRQMQRPQAQQQGKPPSSLAAGAEVPEDDGDEEEGEGESDTATTSQQQASTKPQRKRGRAGKRYKVPEGEPRTPREAGIDYLRQWEGRRG